MPKGHLAVLAHRHAPKRNGSPGPRVLIGALADDSHSIGLRATADLLEHAGFTVLNLGTELPDDQWLHAAAHFPPDVIVVSVAMRTAIARLQKLVRAFRDHDDAAHAQVRFVAGGPAFADVQVDASQVGVDAIATSPSFAVSCVRDLTAHA